MRSGEEIDVQDAKAAIAALDKSRTGKRDRRLTVNEARQRAERKAGLDVRLRF